MQSDEIWRPTCVFGYFVSINGKVSGKRKVALKPQIADNGYFRVCLYDRGIKKYKTVHSLVAEAFIGRRPKGMTINHIDGDKFNNQAGNLEYMSLQDNLKHGWKIGRKCEGDSHGGRRLSSEEVDEIKRLREMGEKIKDLAKCYAVYRGTISDIVNNKSWKNHRALKEPKEEQPE